MFRSEIIDPQWWERSNHQRLVLEEKERVDHDREKIEN